MEEKLWETCGFLISLQMNGKRFLNWGTSLEQEEHIAPFFMMGPCICLVCLLVVREIIVLGGYCDCKTCTQSFNDLYRLDLQTFYWTRVQTTGDMPTPRGRCGLAVDCQSNRMFLLGVSFPTCEHLNR